MSSFYSATVPRDLTAGLVVFLVALPLCLGVALASNAPLLAGVLAGIVGGILVGWTSQSQTSVSGPAAGLAAIVAVQISALGFPAFLLAVVIAGLAQSALGIARAGRLADYVPSSVIQGLLAAIGVLLMLKQLPHLLGHHADPLGDMAFQQPDHANTFTELGHMLGDVHPGAAVIGLASVALLVAWARLPRLKSAVIPAPLAVVFLGVILSQVLNLIGGHWIVEPANLVHVPVAEHLTGVMTFLQWPDFSQWSNPAVYTAGVTLAIVASLETLLNLEAVHKIDPQQRTSPPNYELVTQGIGNVVVGLLGGIPITSVIVRSSANIQAGGQTRLSTITHGVLLLVCVVFLPSWLNTIPLSCLAAILLVTGFKLASPRLLQETWRAGVCQFIPFLVTLVAIVFTDLLIGILIGLAVSVGFILHSNFRRPIRQWVERHFGGDVLHVELASQVSFLNRATLQRVLDEVPSGGNVLLNARSTRYIDPDVLCLLRDYTTRTAPARNVTVSLRGFQEHYQLRDVIQYLDHPTRELQSQVTPQQVLQILQEGHERFRRGERLTRDLGRQVHVTAGGQHPLAVVLSCIDSRVPAELIFDAGLGEIVNVRIAGNVISPEVLGSMEYACATAGAKLILVMGHTRCGAVAAAMDRFSSAPLVSCQAPHSRIPAQSSDGSRPRAPGRHPNSLATPTPTTNPAPEQDADWDHLTPIIHVIQQSIDPRAWHDIAELSDAERDRIHDEVAHRNVSHVAGMVLQRSRVLQQLHAQGRVAVVGAVYDVVTGEMEFMPQG